MNSPSTDLPSNGSPSRSLKAMWATIAALGVAVVAMGGVLLHQRSSETPAAVASAPAATPVQAPADYKPEEAPAPAPMAAAALPAAAAVVAAGPAMAPPPPVRAPAPVPQPYPQVAQAAPPPAVVVPPPPPPVRVCSVCGRVESVTPVQRQVPTSGVGAVAGGVLGGVLGHQVGHGNGRTAATLLGAVGGGFAGNEIEKRTHTVTVYEVNVRMQNGALRRVETHSAPPIGKSVTLQGGVLKPANGQP